jgi:hypothetical protein
MATNTLQKATSERPKILAVGYDGNWGRGDFVEFEDRHGHRVIMGLAKFRQEFSSALRK